MTCDSKPRQDLLLPEDHWRVEQSVRERTQRSAKNRKNKLLDISSLASFLNSELTGLFGHFSFECSLLLGFHVNMSAEVKEGS